jgi:hypothetical protein
MRNVLVNKLGLLDFQFRWLTRFMALEEIIKY